MGFPASRYEALYDLCNMTTESHQDNFLFRKFKLVAIVLHDPDYESFVDTMRNDFVRLDQETTDRFLFMTFMVTPPNAWRDAHRGDELEQAYLRTMTYQGGNIDRKLLGLMKQRLGITEYPPVILLTNNLMSYEFDVIKTSPNRLGKQLKAIGDFCSDCEDERIDNNDWGYLRLLGDIDKDYRRVNLGASLAIVLRDALAPYAMKDHDCCMQQEADWNTQEVLAKLQQRMDALLQDGVRDLEGWEKALLDYSGYLALTLKRSKALDSAIPHIDRGKLMGAELESKAFVDSFNDMSAEVFAAASESDNAFDAAKRMVKLRMLNMFLGEFFENEINSSVVQLMRKCVHIPMPQYFKKYYDEVEIPSIRSGQKMVNLNQRWELGIKWPPLGDSRYLWNVMMHDRKTYPYIESCGNYEWFSRNWSQIATKRNEAGHPEAIVTENDVKDMVHFIDRVLDNHFRHMVSLKQRLSGTDCIDDIW